MSKNIIIESFDSSSQPDQVTVKNLPEFILKNHIQEFNQFKLEDIVEMLYSPSAIESLLRGDHEILGTSVSEAKLFVAKNKEEIVGVLWSCIQKPFLESESLSITDIVIEKDFRNQGIASALKQYFDTWAAEVQSTRNSISLTIDTHNENKAMMALAKKWGFVKIAEEEEVFSRFKHD